MRTDRSKRGQAAVEAAVALGVFILVAVAFFLLARAAVVGLDLQGEVRAEAGVAALSVDGVNRCSGERKKRMPGPVEGGSSVTVGDVVVMPGMAIANGKGSE